MPQISYHPDGLYRAQRIDDVRRMTITYPEVRLQSISSFAIATTISPQTRTTTYAHIRDEDALNVNVPRWNREYRETALRKGFLYPDIEYAIETAQVVIETIEQDDAP